MDFDRTDAQYAADTALVPAMAVDAAVSALINDWGENRRIMPTGRSVRVTVDGSRHVFYVFLCGASDGSRWWLAATVDGEIAYTSDRSGHRLDDLRDECERAAREAEAYLNA